MNTLYNNMGYLALVCSMTLMPSSVLASSVYIHTNHSEFFEGDAVLFSVRVDSEGKNINAVEGEVSLDHEADAISLIGINTSGSALSLWPNKPLPSERNTRISFVGGSPGGFVSKDAIVFNVVLTLHKAGQLALSPNNIAVYLNDGKGTKDEVSVKDLTINVLPKKPDAKPVDDWSGVILNDKTAPEPFEIYLGQEGSVFDGKKFLSFSTTDMQSGISYYEVIEGDLPPARSGETYILKEQDKLVKTVVIAYDSAGNTRESVYSPAAPKEASYPLLLILVSIILLMLLLVGIFKKIRRVRK